MWKGKGYDPEKNLIYKIKDGKGHIKEYQNDNQLIFEGEFLYGEKNGKGKEYYLDKIIFDGEYKNGKKWNGKGYEPIKRMTYELKNGKGFVREYNNPLRFEGEYLNGEKNGKGKEYYTYTNEIIFDGEYLNGKRKNGKTRIHKTGNWHFEGEYLYGKEWKGKYFIKEKLEFEGILLFGRKWDGKGDDHKGNIIYELKNGNGTVKEYDYDEKLMYKGEYKNGKRWNGKGKEYKWYNLGDIIFEGEYKNGKKYAKSTSKLKKNK